MTAAVLHKIATMFLVSGFRLQSIFFILEAEISYVLLLIIKRHRISKGIGWAK